MVTANFSMYWSALTFINVSQNYGIFKNFEVNDAILGIKTKIDGNY